MRISKILVPLLFIFSLINGQEPKYLVKNFDLQASLSLNGSVWCMVQDTMGVIYFGVEGAIITFNGTEWRLFPNNKEVIRALHTDSNGDIWYGTVNDFGRIKRDENQGLLLESVIPGNIDQDLSFGDIWSISESDGKMFFQAKNHIFVSYGNDSIGAFRLDNCYHRGFSLADNYIVNEVSKGLSHYTDSGFKPLPGGEFFRNKILSGAIHLGSDTILLGTREEGVFIYSMLTGEVMPFLTQEPETSSFLMKNRIYHMLSLPDGNLAFATLLNGTLITNRKGKIIKILHYQSGTQDNAHYFLGLSHDSNLWMCTGNGITSLNIYSPFSLWDYSRGVEGVVMSIQGHRGGILTGTLTGLFYLPEPGNLARKVEKILNSEVWHINKIARPDGVEIALVSSGDGLYELAGSDIRQIYKGELILKSIKLSADPSLILSFGANNLHLSRVTNGRIEYLSNISGLFSEFRSVAQEGDRHIWIGTRSLKMIRLSQKSLINTIANGNTDVFDTSESFTFNTLTDVHNIDDQVIFSNATGFLTFEPEKKSFTKCTYLGLSVSEYNKMASVMAPDKKGNIWLGGNELLVNRQDGTYLLHLLPFDPVRHIFSAFAIYHDSAGKTWMGGNKGLYLYDNTVVNSEASIKPVVIDRIVKDDSVRFLALNSCPDDLEGMKLSDGKNIFIHFSLPVYSGDYKSEYSYILEGYSDSWSKWSTQEFLVLNDLSPGKYRLIVKGRTPGGIESETTCFGFSVRRPWYSTIYARVSYLLVIGFILYVLNDISIRRRVRKELIMENIIQKRIQQSIISEVISGNKYPQGHQKSGLKQQNMVESSVHDDIADIPNQERLFMTKLLDAIEENLADSELSVEKLCLIMNMSQTMLYRKLKGYTGLSITSFIRKIRLKNGAQLLLQTDLSISEIAYRVGFNDPGYFTKCFHQEFGQSPKNFQKNTLQS